jgi:hypothetical protein
LQIKDLAQTHKPEPFSISETIRALLLLKIDTLCLEGIYPQKVMRFSQRISGPKNIPQVEQNIVLFGLNSSSVKIKDGQMSMIEGPLHSPKKYKFA